MDRHQNKKCHYPRSESSSDQIFGIATNRTVHPEESRLQDFFCPSPSARIGWLKGGIGKRYHPPSCAAMSRSQTFVPDSDSRKSFNRSGAFDSGWLRLLTARLSPALCAKPKLAELTCSYKTPYPPSSCR